MLNEDVQQDVEGSKQTGTGRQRKAPEGFELCYRDSVTGEILVPGEWLPEDLSIRFVHFRFVQ